MSKLVTVGLPVYKRLEFLPRALESVDAQDYPDIELIVSANGENGPLVREQAEQHCRRPFRFRQNETTVPAPVHYNQLVEAASGEYFVMLCDDDEMSPNFVSELVAALERRPEAALAFGRLEIIDGTGHVMRRSLDTVPETMTDVQFVRAWCRGEHKYESWVTNLARTANVRACGGYHALLRGTGCDDLLVVRLLLGRSAAFNTRGAFRCRIVDHVSLGWSLTYAELANDLGLFLQCLDSDPTLQMFARAQPDRWAAIKANLVEILWTTYFWRWDDIYRHRLSRKEWCKAAFVLPWIPAYYKKAIPLVVGACKESLAEWLSRRGPRVLHLYRRLAKEWRR